MMLVSVSEVTGEVQLRVAGREATTTLDVIRSAAEQDDRELARVYRRVLGACEGAIAKRRYDACPGHSVLRSRERGFFGPVGPARDQNPAAHGNVCIVETCMCGAERSTNVNGRHEEQGEWHLP